MLRISIEIWPNGSKAGARTISEVVAANVSDLSTTSDYVGVLVDDTGTKRVVWVRGHRRADGVWPLVSRLCAPDFDTPPADLDGVVARLRRRLLD